MASASVAMMPQESPPISTVISPSQSGQHTPREHQHPPLALPPELVAEAFPHSGFSSTSNSTASSSVVTTPSAGTSTLVPAYPYNTSLAPFLSPSLGLGGATPDDSEVHTNLPSVQVDYLSHEWAEEDIWTSWKATTKHKAQLVNADFINVNSSWRTWNKQRNNLKTISPETLNWLKDSDVTWLYGPLHTSSSDLVPTMKTAKAEDRLGLDSQVAVRSRGHRHHLDKSLKFKARTTPGHSEARKLATAPKKPILKYRSLSDILTVPRLKRNRFDSYDGMSDHSGLDSPEEQSRATTPTYETASYTVTRTKFLDSPPAVESPGTFPSTTSYFSQRTSPLANATQQNQNDESSDNNESAASESERSGTSTSVSTGRRRHIAFSNRVEQCIAVDSDEDRERYNTAAATATSKAAGKFGSKLQRIRNHAGSYFQRSSSEESSEESTSDEEEEETLLTFRSSRSPSTSTAYTGFAAYAPPHPPAPVVIADHPYGNYTIAKLAPTLLKNSELLPSPSPAVVYSPQTNTISLPDVDVETKHYTYPEPVAQQPSIRYAYPQQQEAGARRHTVQATPAEPIQPSISSHIDSPTQFLVEQDEYTSHDTNDYAALGGISGQDADFSLSDAAYSTGDVAMSGSMYASYDPVPRGHYAAQSQKATQAPPTIVTKPNSPTKTTVSVQPARSILKAKGKSSSESLDSAPTSPIISTQSVTLNQTQVLTADDEYESRGRSLSRGSSTSSLDARSASRNVSASSAGSSSPSPYTHTSGDTPRRVRVPRKDVPTESYYPDTASSDSGMSSPRSSTSGSANNSDNDLTALPSVSAPVPTSSTKLDASIGTAEESGKGKGEDSPRRNLHLESSKDNEVAFTSESSSSLINDATTTPILCDGRASKHHRKSSSSSTFIGWYKERQQSPMSRDKGPPSTHLDTSDHTNNPVPDVTSIDANIIANNTTSVATSARDSLLKNSGQISTRLSLDDETLPNGYAEAEQSGYLSKATEVVATGFDMIEALYNVGISVGSNLLFRKSKFSYPSSSS